MSCFVGPEPVTNGLVLSFDSANARSFKGAPTTNINTTQNLGGMVGISLSFVSIENGWKKYSISGTWASGTYPYSMYISTTTLSGAVAYSAQSIIKTNVRSKFLTFSGLSYVNDVNMVSYGTSTVTSLGPDTDGFDMILSKREGFIYSSGFANPTTNQLAYINSRPTADGVTFNSATDFVWVKNIQVEQGTTCTPWVESTRPNTQVILDLTGQNTLTATSLTYANSGTSYSFDGNANYIRTTSNCGVTGSVTLSAWIRPSYAGQTGPHSTVLSTDPEYPYGVKLMNYKNSARYGLWLGFSGTDNYEAFVLADINDNTNKMLTATWEQSTGIVNIYLNGALQSSISTGKTIPVVLSSGNITLGTDYNSIGSANKNKFLGSIYQGFIYNRALTPLEIQQNFEATRSRYNI